MIEAICDRPGCGYVATHERLASDLNTRGMNHGEPGCRIEKLCGYHASVFIQNLGERVWPIENNVPSNGSSE